MKPQLLLMLTALCFNSGCAHKDIKPLNLDECISDGHSFQCSGPDFASQHSMPVENSYGWICRAPGTDQAFWQACYLQRAKNGK